MTEKILIAGPCAAESMEQVVETARAIAAAVGTQVIFRAGIWKPRTRPDTFQGIGDEALAWLQLVRQETGLLVATEVATADHLHKALAAGVDYLWLGARTTANPIQVQELADTLANTPHKRLRGIFVKNPVNNDAQLWLGDIARIEQTGVAVGAILRGCNHRPCWAMAHTLQQARPDIPLLLDPSHLGGSRERIAPLMEQACTLCLDGAMIEVHTHPEKALSDAQQQITPDALRPVWELFCRRREDQTQVELDWLRAEIDEIDDALWESIARRMEVSERIGQWKQAHAMPPLQPARYEAILHKRKEWATQIGLSSETVEQIFGAIHRESLNRQLGIRS